MVPPLSSDSRAEPANPAASATATRPPMRSPSSTTASATVNKLSVASSNAPCVAAVCTRPKSKSRIASPGSRTPRANTGMLGREGRAPRASAAAHKTSAPMATSTAKRSSGLTCSSATFVRAADSPHDSAARSSRVTGDVRDLAMSVLIGPVTVPDGPVARGQVRMCRAVPPALGGETRGQRRPCASWRAAGRARRRTIAVVPASGPAASGTRAKRQPIASAATGTGRMPAMVKANPRAWRGRRGRSPQFNRAARPGPRRARPASGSRRRRRRSGSRRPRRSRTWTRPAACCCRRR